MDRPSIYSEKAEHFFKQYRQLEFADVHGSWLHLIEDNPEGQAKYALDVGAGSGRDASALAQLGWKVIAIEPAVGLRDLGKSATAQQDIAWLDDELPLLPVTTDFLKAIGHPIQLILASAVWMHLDHLSQRKALTRLSRLLTSGGLIVITLRHGPSHDERIFYETDSISLKAMAESEGLETICHITESDKLLRAAVGWETLVLRKKLSNIA
ncbi:class I SAM-dependent methyltransferase [Allohahella sp. A8]|uniref:class I SAM-dependent methyltransferase n=1 Tax=Allohahella sp. A8 TaxID=3141461 RepID=UPI003A805BD3